MPRNPKIKGIEYRTDGQDHVDPAPAKRGFHAKIGDVVVPRGAIVYHHLTGRACVALGLKCDCGAWVHEHELTLMMALTADMPSVHGDQAIRAPETEAA